MLKIGFLASGRGSNFQAIVDAIEAKQVKAQATLLISDVQDAYALKRAEKHGIPHMFIDHRKYNSMNEYFAVIASGMKAARVGLVVLAGFMRIVRKPLLDAYPMKIINIHPALLPSFAGLHGQRDAVDYGVRISGCTVHFVDKGMDTGPVIIQAAVPTLPEDTEETLAARILRTEHKIFPEAIRLFAEGRLKVHGRKVMISGYDSEPDTDVLYSPPLGC